MMLYNLYLSIYLILLAVIGISILFMLWRYEHLEPITKMKPIDSHIYVFKTSFDERAKTLERRLTGMGYYHIDNDNYMEYAKKESTYYLVTTDKLAYLYDICRDKKNVTVHVMY